MPFLLKENAKERAFPKTGGAPVGAGLFFFFQSRLFLKTTAVLAAIGCLAILSYSFHSGMLGQFLRVSAVGILVAGAASASGCLLGFIFAIPRVGAPAVGERKRPSARETPSAESVDLAAQNSDEHAYLAARDSQNLRNGNLVEISDWLTKIIVGIGLVELHSIIDGLSKLSYYLAPGLQPVPCLSGAACADSLSSAQAAGMAIVVFYFALGFLMGYVWTMVFFPSDLKEENWLLSKLIERRNASLAKKNEELNQKNDKLTKLVHTTNALFAAEGHICKGQLDEAMKIIEKAIADDPTSGAAVMTKARILKRIAMKSEPPDPDRLKQAITCANHSIALLPDKGEPLYNKACYQALLDPNNLKVEVIANLKSAFLLNPALRQLAKTEVDLASIGKDTDFIDLTGEPPKPGA